MAKFVRPVKIWIQPEEGETLGPYLIIHQDTEVQGLDTVWGGPGQIEETVRITMVRCGPQPTKENSKMKNISTKEQVAVRTEMADVIKEAVEAKYGKVRTWTETETVGPLGGVSAQVFGAVEHEGKVVPFAINVYSDDRIQEKLEAQLEQDAENGVLRGKLGW